MMLKEQSFQERVKKFENSLTFEMLSTKCFTKQI